MVDKILNFRMGFKKDSFNWTDSVLYKFLCDYYGISDVLLETCYGMVLVKKHNVVGYINGNDYITVYESVGELDNVKWRVYLNTIHSIIALEA